MKKCLVIGAAMLDIIMEVRRLPKTGQDIYVSKQSMNVGGCAYNVANILEHFGVPSTLLAPVGEGIYGKFIGEALRKTNHMSPISVEDADNGYCLCMVEENGERTFVTVPGVECEFRKEWFERLDLEEYDSVYVSGYEIEGSGGEVIIEFLENHRELMLYYAPGPRITYIEKEKTERMDKLSAIVHLNEAEALAHTRKKSVQEAAKELFSRTQNTVIITVGEKGAYLYEKGEGKFVNTKHVPVVDTIGAGDSHMGTIIAVRKLGYDYQLAVEKANQVSGLVVGEKGSTLTREKFEKGRILLWEK